MTKKKPKEKKRDRGGSGYPRGGGDDGEVRHFLDVCWSCMKYKDRALEDLRSISDAIADLDANDLDMWDVDPDKWAKQIKVCIQINSNFLSQLPCPDVSGVELGPDDETIVRTVPPTHQVDSSNASKVVSTLRQFVRDWAAEGAAERAASYGPLIEALQQRLPARGDDGKRLGNGLGYDGAPKVLCPGCGLARLPYDLAALGYDAQGNEFSYHMLLGSHLVLNKCEGARAWTIYPFAGATCHRFGRQDHLQQIKIPEIDPCGNLPEDSALSMTAGEFIDVYADQAGEWDALCSAWFLDTAKNIFQYIRHFAELIRPGGWWLNLGPLLFHYAESENEISIELSWEEVKPAIEKYFTIDEHYMRDASYTTITNSMYAVKYHCMFFAAQRNDRPIEGKSCSVFSN